MTNIALTHVCNLACPYCFAATTMNQMGTRPGNRFIALDDFAQRLDFLERSGMRQARLIGGEPTLHPQFAEIMAMARGRGFTIMLFSNGLMPSRALDCLAALSPAVCLVLLNMNASHGDGQLSQTEVERRRTTLQRLGPRALLGFNIYQPNFALDELLTLIRQYQCQPAIRLGLAQPILGGENVFLSPKQYPLVGDKIATLARHAAAQGITLEFDCGFVRCMFSQSAWQILQESQAKMGLHCNPILDINLDGQVIHCFPLTGRVQTDLRPQTNATTLRQQLAQQTQPYRLSGMYPECSSCPFKQRGECTGGCLAHTLHRFRHRSIRLVVPDRNNQKASV